MSLQTDLIEALKEKGFALIYWGYIPSTSSRTVIVRPGGFVDGREVVEVWVVNTPSTDPDDGLAGFAGEVYQALRSLLLNVVGTPGPEYNPTSDPRVKGINPRSTIVFTGQGKSLEGLGTV